MSPRLADQLDLPRCPHCGIANPRLSANAAVNTTAHNGGNQRYWRIYICATCGGVFLV